MADRLYSVTGQLATRASMNGRVVDVYEIHYSGPNGITGYVRIPTDTATADQVDQLIRTQLDEQLRIAQLGVTE